MQKQMQNLKWRGHLFCFEKVVSIWALPVCPVPSWSQQFAVFGFTMLPCLFVYGSVLRSCGAERLGLQAREQWETRHNRSPLTQRNSKKFSRFETADFVLDAERGVCRSSKALLDMLCMRFSWICRALLPFTKATWTINRNTRHFRAHRFVFVGAIFRTMQNTPSWLSER
jgi:hypothetical protein